MSSHPELSTREPLGAHAEELLGLAEVALLELELDALLEQGRAELLDHEAGLLA